LALSAGTRLGPYEILAPLGAGGMGEVYRARDTKLGRDVAIKVLPPEVARDPDRLARFQREAQLLASLNHPHIAAIHGLEEADGSPFLVLELVEGEDLAGRMKRGPIPVDETLDLAKQMAEALEEAHDKGIVHRDLNPANVKLTLGGKVKVLDFGLAKALASERTEGSAGEPSQSPTMSARATAAGVILGTAAYMSPEQARGMPVDKRADIWAFGVVVFEMLTGQRLFTGEDVSDTLASILKEEPDWTLLPLNTPRKLSDLLHRCLRKDARNRLRDIGDARIEIEDALSGAPEGVSVVPAAAKPESRWRQAIPWILVGLMVAVALGLYSQRRPAEAPQLVRTSIVPPSGQRIGWPDISPDGTRIVYTALEGAADDGRLYLRHLGGQEATPIPGTERGMSPFFSPDGEWIGFVADGQLKKVGVDGVGAVALSEANRFGGSWGRDGTMVFTLEETGSGLVRIRDDGGTPEVLTTLDADRQETSHLWPQVLPNGKAVLFSAWSGGFGEGSIFVQSLSSGERRFLAQGDHAHYLPTGHLVLQRGGSLYAMPFDPERLEVTSTGVPVQAGVLPASDWDRTFAISETGTLVYIPDRPAARRLVLVDLEGQVEPLAAPPMLHRTARFSPDGRELAITTSDYLSVDSTAPGKVHLYELEHARFSVLFSSFEDVSGTLLTPWATPAADWSPDGTRLAIAARGTAGALGGTFILPVDRSGAGVRSAPGWLASWSPDGTRLVYIDFNGDGWDIWERPLEPEGEPRPLVQNPGSDQSEPILSPDGRWLAYASNESGQEQVYVKPYDIPGGSRQISVDWGTAPLWSPDGRTIYYRDRERIMAVEIQPDPTLSAGRPRLLFEGALDLDPDSNVRAFDLSPDGQRFVMLQGEGGSTTAQIQVALNWFEELKRLVPTD
jgi:serine/threonine-protein kinase